MNQAKPIPLRRQQRDFTRQRLLDGARTLFLQKGARATSVDDIAKAAGTSRATFYAHFTDKQDVMREFAREIYETAFTTYGIFAQLEEWTYASIGGWMRQVFDAWEIYSDTTGILLQEMVSEMKAEFLVQFQHRVDALIGDGPLWKRFDTAEANRRASLLLFQLERCMEARHYGGWQEEREALIGTLTAIWVGTLARERARV